MKLKTKGLGKGLGAIFEIEEINIPKQSASSRRDSTVSEIGLSLIVANPNQPRTVFDSDALAELAQSISRLGVIQPITVKRIESGTDSGIDGEPEYMIISGERRFRASQMLGLDTIPTYVRQANDQTLLEMALVENIQREDLNAIEVALSLQRLVDECSLTQEALAERVGKRRSTVANYIRLLKLPVAIQSALSSDMISMGHARSLLSLPSERQQLTMLARIVKQHMSVRQTELAVQQTLAQISAGAKPKATKDGGEYPSYYSQVVERLEPLLGSHINIKRIEGKNGGIAGKIVINFESDEQVHEILERLKKLGTLEN